MLGRAGKSALNSKTAKENKGKSSSAKSQKPFSKSGKANTTNVVKGNEQANDADYELFPKSLKSGKSQSSVEDTGHTEPHKLFAKSGKMTKSTKAAGKSAKAAVALFHKSSKSSIEGTYDASGLDVENESEIEVTTDSDNEIVLSAPTLSPTCDHNSVGDAFDLCIAIDASGSVCSSPNTLDCNKCSPLIFCRDDPNLDRDTCCTNFATIKQFTSNVISTFDERFSADKSFSIVMFSDDATIESPLLSAEATLQAVEAINYSGGSTSHKAAIEVCEHALVSTSEIDRKKIILLVTDGVSTAPEPDPSFAAESAATNAKNDGTTIIPVFISSEYDEDALAFMSRLSSDGNVFNVADFDLEKLNSLQESLVAEVSCS